jgi:hypothetical protein
MGTNNRPLCESEIFCSEKAKALTVQEGLAWIVCALKDLICAINSFSSIFNRTKIKDVELELVYVDDSTPSTLYKYESGVPFIAVGNPNVNFSQSYVDTTNWIVYFTGPSILIDDYEVKQTIKIIII